MAMRLYTKDEFEAELVEKWGLTPTEEIYSTFSLWRTSTGHFITVPAQPDGELYPDHFLDQIISNIEKIES